MTQRFDDKLYDSVKAPNSDRNRMNEFRDKKTVEPTTKDEEQAPEIERKVTVLLNGKEFCITCDDSGTSMVDTLEGHGISVQKNGDIIMISGSGGNGKACGGRFLINAKGGQLAKYEGPVITEASAANPADSSKGEGSDTTESAAKDKVACSNTYYGDAITECHGEVRIRGTKVVIEAADVLSLVGKSKVLIQAGPSGGGEIQLNAGQIKQTADTSIEEILGQKSTTVAEKTDLQFDPRASVNIISPGHVNWQVLGDYQQNIGGVANIVATGLPSVPPLVEDRTNSYAIRTTGIAKGISLDSVTDVNINAALQANITAIGNVNIKGALIFLN